MSGAEVHEGLRLLNQYAPNKHKRSQRRKYPDITLRDNVAVLVPEVPDVTEKIDSFRIRREAAQKVSETTLPVGWITDLQASMDI